MQLPKIYANIVNKGKIDLTLSVNPLGCSPRAMEQLAKITMTDLSSYPDMKGLTRILAKRFNIMPKQLVLGNGSEQLIKLIAQTFLQPKDEVTVENGSFGVFTKESLLAKALVKSVQIENFLTISPPKLIFLANPKTPTGELIDTKFLQTLTQRLPKTIIVIDEATGEFMNKSFIREAINTQNTLVLRTFSKVLGLAGLRIGVAIGSEALISKLLQAQQPFPVSQVAIKLTQAALTDTDFISKTIQFVSKERTFLKKELDRRGIKSSDSITNNLFIELPNAADVIAELAKLGVAVIDGKFFPSMEIPGFRISLKDRQTNQKFLSALDQALTRTNSLSHHQTQT